MNGDRGEVVGSACGRMTAEDYLGRRVRLRRGVDHGQMIAAQPTEEEPTEGPVGVVITAVTEGGSFYLVVTLENVPNDHRFASRDCEILPP